MVAHCRTDAQLPVLTLNSMLFSQPNILPWRELHYEENPQIRRSVKLCKDAIWNRWTKEYLRGLRERHTVTHKDSPCGVEKGDVCLIKDNNKDRNKWKLGIEEELIAGRDGVVRAVKLRAGKRYLERAVQQLYLLELSCDKSREAPKPPLNPEALAFRPRRDAAVAARLRVQDIAECDQDKLIDYIDYSKEQILSTYWEDDEDHKIKVKFIVTWFIQLIPYGFKLLQKNRRKNHFICEKKEMKKN